MKTPALDCSHSITLALVLVSLVQVSSPDTAVSQSVITEGLSPSFKAVASQLELGGRLFKYSESGGMLWMSEFLDEMLKVMPASQRKDMPPDFSFVKLAKIIGMDSCIASGQSARQRADGSFHSLGFSYMPQGRKGLFTLTGGPSKKLLLHEVAPKDTDLAIELSINLKDFTHDSLPSLMNFMPPADREKAEREMSAQQPPLGLSAKQVMENLDARIGIFIRLDPTQKFQPAPDAPVFPGADAVIVLDHMSWLMEPMMPQLMEAMQQPKAPATASMEGGMFFIRAKAPAGPAPMDFQPVLRFDPKADRILIATRPAFFDSVATGKDKIADGKDFAQAWRDLPTEGNACVYASRRFLQTAVNLMQTTAAKNGGKDESNDAIVQKIFQYLNPVMDHSQAMVLVNRPDGIMTAANTSLVLESSTWQTLSVISVLSSLAVPAFSKVSEKGSTAKEINNLKQLVVGLKLYAADNSGAYPAQLSLLTKDGILDDGSLLEYTNPVTHEHQAWYYNAQLTDSSDGRALLLATPVPRANGKRVAAFNDGSVREITEAEFQALTK